MAKEAELANYPGLVFRETFNNEQATRKNGGTPTDVTFSEGKGTFNGTSSKVNYALGLNGTYSVRVRCNPTVLGVTNELLDVRGSNNDGVGTIISSSGTLSGSSGTDYVNGSASTTLTAGVNNEIVVSGITLTEGTGANLSLIGSNFADGNEWNGTIDLVEIYDRVLTPSEISNMYNDSWNKEQVFDGAPQSDVAMNGDLELGSGDVFTDWTQNEVGSSTITESPTGGVDGSRAALFTGDGSSSFISLIQSGYVTDKKKYFVKFKAKRVSGTIWDLEVISGSNSSGVVAIASTEFAEYTATVIADGTDWAIKRANLTSSSLIIDDISIQELNPETLIDYDATNGAIQDRTVGNVVGDNLLSGWDFTNWTQFDVGSVTNSSFITTGAPGYVRKASITTIGKKYKLFISGSISSGTLDVRDSTTTSVKSLTGSFSEAFNYVSQGELIELRGLSSGATITIDTLFLYEIRSPLVNTDVTIVKDGTFSSQYNGSTSKIDTGTDMIGTKAITCAFYIKPFGWGESNVGRILSNNKLVFNITTTNDRLLIRSDGGATVGSATNSIVLLKKQFVCVTRTAAGVANFYIGDESTPPALSGSADQDSGTPEVGTANVHIGNDASGTGTFDGNIAKGLVVESILTIAQLTQLWSEWNKEIN